MIEGRWREVSQWLPNICKERETFWWSKYGNQWPEPPVKGHPNRPLGIHTQGLLNRQSFFVVGDNRISFGRVYKKRARRKGGWLCMELEIFARNNCQTRPNSSSFIYVCLCPFCKTIVRRTQLIHNVNKRVCLNPWDVPYTYKSDDPVRYTPCVESWPFKVWSQTGPSPGRRNPGRRTLPASHRPTG